MVADKQNKISIRFFNDQEVRAAWDYDGNRWLFSVADVNNLLTDSDRRFLISFEYGKPEWDNYEFAHFKDFPSVK